MSTDIKLSLISLKSKEILAMIVLDDDRDITLDRAKAELIEKYPPSEYASYFELTRMSERWEQLDKEENQ